MQNVELHQIKFDRRIRKNEGRYINDAGQKTPKLMQYENGILIEENNCLLLNVQKRQLYKLYPFHIEDKESLAGAMIIETLINILSSAK